MDNTRQQIMAYLQSKRMASASELGRALHMTAANARHHLGILLAEGVIEIVGQRPIRGRGRPTQLYGLSEQERQANLDTLGKALLDEHLSTLSEEEMEAFLRRVAVRMAESVVMRSNKRVERFFQAIQWLNQHHYFARWEAHAGGPQIIFGHCPYLSILVDHPELCRMDAYLLEELGGLPADQVAKLKPNLQGIPQCVFILGKRK